MPNLRGNTSAKKRRRQNKVQRVKKKIEFNVGSHNEEQFQSCDATEPVVVSNTVECNDGFVSDNNKESCDSVEPEVVSATNDTLTPKERQLMKKERFSKYYYLNHKIALKNQRSIVMHIKIKYLLTQNDAISLTMMRD